MGLLKLITFDVTHTLLKFRLPTAVQYARVAKEYGLIVDSDVLQPAFAQKWKSLNLKHPNYGCTTGITSQQWWTEFVIGTFKDSGYTEASDLQLTIIAHHLYKLFSTNVCWDVYDGSQNLLRSLRARKLRIGVISNFDERLEPILRQVGLHSNFDFILCSYIVKCAKPDKRIFDLALQACKDNVRPQEALHVGDNVVLDYLAARNAGWNAVLLGKKDNSSSHPEVDERFVVKNIGDVESIVFGDTFKS